MTRALTAAVLAASFAAARADGGVAAPRDSAWFALAGKVGPAGLMAFAGAERRWEVPDATGPLARGRYGAASLALGVNSAYAQVTAAGEWVPVAPIELRAQWDGYGFFGANGALVRFPSAGAPFGDSQRQALPASAGVGQRVEVAPALRLRAGPFILRSAAEASFFALSPSRGWYYEWEYDTLVARRDVVLFDRTALLAEIWRGAGAAVLLAGPAWDVTWAAAAGIARQRLLAQALWVAAERAHGLERPRLFAQAGVNLVDRNRAGELFAALGVAADVALGAR